MLEECEPACGIKTCTVEVDPSEVHAGALITLVGTVSGFPARRLEGRALLIKDEADALLGNAELIELNGDISRTGPLVMKAPIKPGQYVWRAVLPEDHDGTDPKEQAAGSFSFVVKPHSVSVIVWDVPPATVAGDWFAVKIGVKCSPECPQTDWTLEVSNHKGAVLATAEPRGEPWPGTTGLHFAEVALEAPGAEGLYRWTVKPLASDPEIQYEALGADFGVRVVRPAECLVRVEAIDGTRGTPVGRAKVVIHPYRAYTDEHGVAEIRLPRGEYSIFVSGRNYIPFHAAGEVTAWPAPIWWPGSNLMHGRLCGHG